MQQRSVRDLMQIRHGLVATESSTLREVAERLIISDCDLMAVTDEHGKLAGVVCESSIVRALLANPAQDVTIQSIVARHAESVRIDASIATVQPLFRSGANTAIPVVDAEGRVCGMLMRSDIVLSLLNRNTESAAVPAAPNSKSNPAAPITAFNSIASFVPPKKRTIHEADATMEVESKPPGPHFLRADSARRILWPAEDRL